MILKTRKLNFMANPSTCGAKAGRPAKIAGGPAIRRVVGFVRLICDYFGRFGGPIDFFASFLAVRRSVQDKNEEPLQLKR